jgi:hypothetical protein
MALRITKPEINIREKLTELEGKADKSPAFLATGGTESVVDGYKYHTFTSSGTFTVISGSYPAQCLIVAGGAGGGGSHGGGGGAGGYRTTEEVMFGPTTYSVIVGAGGAQRTGNGTGYSGGNSSLTLGSITSLGGGGGGFETTGGNGGGSGGGGGHGALQVISALKGPFDRVTEPSVVK